MFMTAMTTNIITTANNAVSLSTPDNSGESEGRVSLFFKAIRGINDDTINNMMLKAYTEDPIDTVILAFYTRDCRGGKGEREIGRKMFKWLYRNEESCMLLSKVAHLIPEYGRWDDILTFFPKVLDTYSPDSITLQQKFVSLYCNQIQKDYQLMIQGNPISLAAKWISSEGDSDDRKYKLVSTICDFMKIDHKTYRKKYITPMRAYLQVLETKMCSNSWDEINFSKVPSCATVSYTHLTLPTIYSV